MNDFKTKIQSLRGIGFEVDFPVNCSELIRKFRQYRKMI